MSFSRIIAVCLALCAVSLVVNAETEHDLALKLASKAGYIDNFLYVNDNAQGTPYYTLSSALAFDRKSQYTAFTLNANVASYFFDNFSNDNHREFNIAPEYQFKFSQNQRIYVSASWRNNYSYRGTGLSLGQAEQLAQGDKQQNVAATMGYEYGTVASQGRLNLDVGYQESQFTTRRAVTSRLDADLLNLHANFDYLLSGKTFLAFDLNYKKTEFPFAVINNHESISGLVGVKWHTTVISELNFLIGYQNLRFMDAASEDDKAFRWRFDYIWRPSEFTTLQLVSTRKFDESYRIGNSYRLAQSHQIDLSYAFSETINIFTSIGVNKENFISQQQQKDPQKESYLLATLALNYKFSERVSAAVNYRYSTLSVDFEHLGFVRNQVGISLELLL